MGACLSRDILFVAHHLKAMRVMHRYNIIASSFKRDLTSIANTVIRASQVSRARIKAGEELQLRQTLKRMEGRRSAVEQCGLARMSISGGGENRGATSGV